MASLLVPFVDFTYRLTKCLKFHKKIKQEPCTPSSSGLLGRAALTILALQQLELTRNTAERLEPKLQVQCAYLYAQDFDHPFHGESGIWAGSWRLELEQGGLHRPLGAWHTTQQTPNSLRLAALLKIAVGL